MSHHISPLSTPLNPSQRRVSVLPVALLPSAPHVLAATLESGAQVNVPIFIEEGEVVRIDTDDRKYLGRANN
jgi:hypothetical protein